MITRIALAFVLSLFAVQATAQSTRLVRSGEHATYSRLVIPMGDGQLWELRTVGRRTEFIVPGWEGDFDYSTVFDRIPKTRILSLNSKTEDGDTRLLMSLGCACEVKASISGQYVVIDVIREATEFAGFEKQEGGDERAGTDDTDDTAADAARLDAGAEAIAADIQPDPEDATAEGATTPDPFIAALAAVIDPDPASMNGVDPAEDKSADETRPNSAIADRLIAQLQAAAQQGIVELQTDPEPEPEPEPMPEPTPPPPGLEPEERNLDSLGDFADRFQQQIAETIEESDGSVRFKAPKGPVAKRGGSQPQPKKPEKEEPKFCLSEESLNADRWIDDEPFVDQLNELRNNLIGEFDKPDPYAVRDLARFYIAVGFGVEALALLEDMEFELADRDILMEMAEAAEGAPHKPGGVFHRAVGCDGATALWRTIIVDQGEDQPVQNADRLVQEFANLPVELRRRFGPRLVQSFLSRNQIEDARNAFVVLDRAAGEHGAGHEMMRARLLEMDGDLTGAEEIYVDLYVGNAENAPQALARLANLYLKSGRPIPPEMMNDLEAEATKYRYENVGPELRLIEIRAKAGSRQMSDALDVVTAQIGQDADIDGAYLKAADQILSLTKATDLGAGTYATTIFDHSDLVVRPEIRPETQIHVASELTGIGLPQPALGILARPVELGTPRADLAAATAHMAMDNPNAALSALKDGDTAAHNSVRGRALASLGRHTDAFTAVQAGSAAPEEAAMYAWRAGEWQFAAASGSAPIRDFARYMVARDLGDTRPPALPGDPPSPEEESSFARAAVTPEDVSLANATAAFTQSKDTRKQIADALSAF